jgi:hypothetical protein
VTPLLEDIVPQLTGDFVLCSGSLPGDVARLSFSNDHVELWSADGALLESARLQLDGMSHPRAHLVVGSLQRQWQVVASRRPLKLQIRELTDPRHATAVFSAVPQASSDQQ